MLHAGEHFPHRNQGAVRTSLFLSSSKHVHLSVKMKMFGKKGGARMRGSREQHKKGHPRKIWMSQEAKEVP
jgi:hypothetical protein